MRLIRRSKWTCCFADASSEPIFDNSSESSVDCSSLPSQEVMAPEQQRQSDEGATCDAHVLTTNASPSTTKLTSNQRVYVGIHIFLLQRHGQFFSRDHCETHCRKIWLKASLQTRRRPLRRRHVTYVNDYLSLRQAAGLPWKRDDWRLVAYLRDVRQDAGRSLMQPTWPRAGRGDGLTGGIRM